MPTQQKIQVVEETQKRFQDSKGTYLTVYTGINVQQATKLRDGFRAADVEYKVIKNTLALIAAKNAGFDGLDDIFKGQIGIAFSNNDPTAPARVIKEFNKKSGSIEVVGVLFEGENFDASMYKELANLPSREELYAKLLGCLSQPMSKLASTLGGAMSKLANVLDSLKETKA